MDDLPALVVGGLITIIGGSLSIIASRKFGLPGLGREVESRQSQLITTLSKEIDECRRQRDEYARELEATKKNREECETELSRVSRDLRATEAELLELYRKSGHKPPRRLSRKVGGET